MPEYRRVITLPLPAKADADDDMPTGERPDRLKSITKVIHHYVTRYRLPESLQDVAVNVEAFVRPELRGIGGGLHAELVMDLILFTDGQLPLPFRQRRGEGENAALAAEMDRLTEELRASLLASNPIWVEGSAIAANDPAPADDLKYLRWKSGRQAPKRPPNAIVPALMQIAADETPLPLVMPEVRPEYVEPLEIEIHAAVSPSDRQLMLSVSAIFGRSVPDGSHSVLEVGSRLRPRVLDELRQRFVYLACNAGLLNIPLRLRGRVVVSMASLKPKAFEISKVLNRDDVTGGLKDFVEIL